MNSKETRFSFLINRWILLFFISHLVMQLTCILGPCASLHSPSPGSFVEFFNINMLWSGTTYRSKRKGMVGKWQPIFQKKSFETLGRPEVERSKWRQRKGSVVCTPSLGHLPFRDMLLYVTWLFKKNKVRHWCATSKPIRGAGSSCARWPENEVCVFIQDYGQ